MASPDWDPSGEDPFHKVSKEIQQVREEAYCAAEEGRAADLAKCLETGYLFYTEHHNGLIRCAFKSQSIPTFEVLLQHGWDVNMPEDWDYPPFLGKIIRDGYYSGSLNMELLLWFLDHGANPNAYAGIYAITPLSNAVRYGSLDLVKLLLDYGGSVAEGDLVYYLLNTESLHHDPEFFPKVRFLIDKGAPINESLFERFPRLLDVTMFTYTPLINACIAGNTELVRLLLAGGADPRKQAWVRLTPLRAAEEYGHKEVKRMLLVAIALLPRL